MVRPASKVRYIKPESVNLGDRLKVTAKVLDTFESVVGIAVHRERDGQWTMYTTAAGRELLRYHPAHKFPHTIKLVERKTGETVLPGMEGV